MDKAIRVAHYLNQFFAGIGGEDKASVGVEAREGAVGPGKLVEASLRGRGTVVGTVICGDNFLAERPEEAVARIVEEMAGFRPQVVIAGPAFHAGRYGLACAQVCAAVQERLGVPAVTAMHPENPGVELYRSRVYIVPTGGSAAAMAQAVPPLVELACKLALGEPLGPAEEEGYIPRGFRRNALSDRTAAERAVDMLLRKLRKQPFRTELPLPALDRVAPPPPIADLSRATIALVTEGGIVPEGNPDNLEVGRSTRWAKYSLVGIRDLTEDSHDAIHGGYDTFYANRDPDRVLPVDVMRELEAEGVIGKLHETYYVTCGMATYVGNAKKFGQAIGKELKEAHIDGVLAVST